MRLMYARVPALASLLLFGACTADRFPVGDLDGLGQGGVGSGGAPGAGGAIATGGAPGAGGAVATGTGGIVATGTGGVLATGGTSPGGGAGGKVPGQGGTASDTGGSGGQIGSGGGSGGPPPGCTIAAAALPVRPLAISSEQVADRLARFLRGDRADVGLVQQAAAATTSADVVALARKMVERGEAQVGIDALVNRWLELDEVRTATADAEVAVFANTELRTSMRQETVLFMNNLMATRATLADLFSAPYAFVDARLADLYGLPPGSMGFNQVNTDPAQRFGLLTQASFLFSRPRASARGKWVRSKLLCQEVPPPPELTNFPPVMPGSGETYRAALQRSLANPACAACHALMDPVGFAFENYDPLGRYRTTDHGAPIDASGTIVSFTGNQEIKFTGALELSRSLASSCDVQSCVAQVFLSQAVGGALRDSDQSSKAELAAAWAAAGFELRELLVLTTGTRSFLAP
jgi:hypothetical protein